MNFINYDIIKFIYYQIKCGNAIAVLRRVEYFFYQTAKLMIGDQYPFIATLAY